MKPTGNVLAVGIADSLGIAGTPGLARSWAEIGTPPPGTGRTVRELFGRADPTFRRIDLMAKAMVLACEAAGLRDVLTESQREQTAIVVETSTGAIETDLRFAATLGDECVAAAAFPFSLTSTCLGEVALRYGLRGPTYSLSVHADHRGDAMREALRMLAADEVRHAIVGTVECTGQATRATPVANRASADAIAMHCVVAVVAVAAAPVTANVVTRLEWPERGSDPFESLAQLCR